MWRLKYKSALYKGIILGSDPTLSIFSCYIWCYSFRNETKKTSKQTKRRGRKILFVHSKSPWGHGALWRASLGSLGGLIWWHLFGEFLPVDRAVLEQCLQILNILSYNQFLFWFLCSASELLIIWFLMQFAYKKIMWRCDLEKDNMRYVSSLKIG